MILFLNQTTIESISRCLFQKFGQDQTATEPDTELQYYSDDYVYFYQSEGSVGNEEDTTEMEETVVEAPPDVVTFEEDTLEDAVNEIVTVMESGEDWIQVSGAILVIWSLHIVKLIHELYQY